MLKYNITTKRFYVLKSPRKHMNHDVNKQKRFDLNVHILKLIIKAVNLCSKQELPLRGHRDNSSDLILRDCSFLAVVKTLADMDSILKDHQKTGSKNAQTT